MYITICGRFRLNEGGVAGYGNRMKAKYTVNWGVQIAGMIFQTRSRIAEAISEQLTACYLQKFKGGDWLFGDKFAQMLIANCVSSNLHNGIKFAHLIEKIEQLSVSTFEGEYFSTGVIVSSNFAKYFQGGKYAAYHFKGFPQFLFMVYQEIFCRWLSKTGNQLDERRPIFDIYRLVGENGYMEIDICFPLK